MARIHKQLPTGIDSRPGEEEEEEEEEGLGQCVSSIK